MRFDQKKKLLPRCNHYTSLQIQASDSGVPPRRKEHTLRVNILDVNDNPPIIGNPFGYNVSVNEVSSSAALYNRVSVFPQNETCVNIGPAAALYADFLGIQPRGCKACGSSHWGILSVSVGFLSGIGPAVWLCYLSCNPQHRYLSEETWSQHNTLFLFWANGQLHREPLGAA